MGGRNHDGNRDKLRDRRDGTKARLCIIFSCKTFSAPVRLTNHDDLSVKRSSHFCKKDGRHFRRPLRFCSHHWPCARSICAKTSSTLKLDGFCRGGKSLNVATNCATNA